jgi:hypothetical protein
VLMLEAAGYPNRKGALREVAQQLKRHERTLSRWFNRENNPPPDILVTKKKIDLLEMLREEIAAILGEMGEKRTEATYRDLAVALGITIERLQLLSGESTANINQHVIIEYAEDIVTEAATVADERYQAIEAL